MRGGRDDFLVNLRILLFGGRPLHFSVALDDMVLVGLRSWLLGWLTLELWFWS